MKELEDSAGIGLVEKMQGEGENFNSKDKSLATKGVMKILNYLLNARADQLVSTPRYNQIQDQLIDIQEKISGGGSK